MKGLSCFLACPNPNEKLSQISPGHELSGLHARMGCRWPRHIVRNPASARCVISSEVIHWPCNSLSARCLRCVRIVSEYFRQCNSVNVDVYKLNFRMPG